MFDDTAARMALGSSDEFLERSHEHECRDCGEGFDCDGYDGPNGCDLFDGSCPECHELDNSREMAEERKLYRTRSGRMCSIADGPTAFGPTEQAGKGK